MQETVSDFLSKEGNLSFSTVTVRTDSLKLKDPMGRRHEGLTSALSMAFTRGWRRQTLR